MVIACSFPFLPLLHHYALLVIINASWHLEHPMNVAVILLKSWVLKDSLSRTRSFLELLDTCSEVCVDYIHIPCPCRMLILIVMVSGGPICVYGYIWLL